MHGGHSNEVTFAFVIITLNICLFIFCRGECICVDSVSKIIDRNRYNRNTK